MPDNEDLSYDDVSRAAAAAADEPDFAVIAARGVQRRNRRRASYAGLTGVALLGTLGVVQLAGHNPDSSPDPAPEPLPSGLVFTRADGSTFSPVQLTVRCERTDGTQYVVVTGPIPDKAPADPERSEQTFSANLRLRMDLDEVRDGAQLPLTDPSGSSDTNLFAGDPTTEDEWNMQDPDSTGQIRVASATCGTTPALVAEVDGVLGSDTSDATVEVRGALALEAEKLPDARNATAIVQDPDSRFVDLAVADDPGTQAAVWQLCRSGDDCVEKYAVVVTDDGFATRTVVDQVFPDRPLIVAAGPAFHVQTGLGPGEFLKPDGSLIAPQPGPVTAPGAVVSTGSGLPLWTVMDGEHATAMLLPDGARDLGSVIVLSDGSLVGTTYGDDPALARSTDLGKTWQKTPLDVGRNALLTVIDGGDGRAVVVEGSDGATLFPFVAVHRQEVAGGPFTKFTPDGDPRAYLNGEAVLPDGRLLISVEAWSDTKPGPVFVTRPGLYVSAGHDWSTYKEVEVGKPYTGDDAFQPEWLATSVTDDAVTVFLRGSQAVPALSTSDAGQTWLPDPGR